MSDNISLGGYCGNVVLATDDIANVHYQRTKVNFGSDGAATDVSLANPLPITMVSPLPLGVSLASSDTFNVNVVSFSNGTDVGNGSVDTETQRVTIADDSTGVIDCSKMTSLVDTNNSTTTPLNAGIVFTGTGTDVLAYSSITITLYASHASAASGMTFQFSTDDTNWDDIYSFNMDAGATRRFQFPITAQYFRVVYTNGGTNQTAFRVQTLLHPGNQLTSIHRLVDNMTEDRSAQVVKTALFAHDGGNDLFKPVAIHEGGELEVQVHAGDDGGCDVFRSLDVDESPEEVKAGKGNIFWFAGQNLGAQERFLKFYDEVSVGAVTVGTTIPVMTVPLTRTAHFSDAVTQGIQFSNGISIACTTGLADADTGAPGVNDLIVNIAYK